jgi:hypothetical protein
MSIDEWLVFGRIRRGFPVKKGADLVRPAPCGISLCASRNQRFLKYPRELLHTVVPVAFSPSTYQ